MNTFLKNLITFVLCLCLTGCFAHRKMSGLDRALTPRKFEKLSTGQTKLTLGGIYLQNPLAAVETFHQFAEDKIQGPYTASYTLKVEKLGPDKPLISSTAFQKATSTEKAQEISTSSDAPYIRPYTYVPVPVRPIGGHAIGSGEAAVIAVGIVALIVLIKIIDNQLEKNRLRKRALRSSAMIFPNQTPFSYESLAFQNTNAAFAFKSPSKTETHTLSNTLGLDDRVGFGNNLSLEGIVTPITSARLSTTRPVVIIPPTGQPISGNALNSEKSLAVANVISDSFSRAGFQSKVANNKPSDGYVVALTPLRIQGGSLNVTKLSFETTVKDARSGRELSRFMLQSESGIMNITATNEALSLGFSPSLLTKPMDKKIARWLK